MKRKQFKVGMIALVSLLSLVQIKAQTKNDFKNPSLIHFLNDDHTRYVQFSGYAELWGRYTQLNPGSTINNEQKSGVSDLSLRRIRVKMTFKPTEHLLFVLQAGPTNVNSNAKGNTYFDLLDAYGEYTFNSKIAIGAGRSTWRGLSRFSTGPQSTLLYDLPAYATSNAGTTDTTVRELSLYLKGQLGKLDYRLVLADPYTSTTSDPKLDVATFSKEAANKHYSGYFKYAFLDAESNATPFNAGTYIGKKQVLSLGAGFDYMHDALWHKDLTDKVIRDDMKSFAVDLFYDTPINKENGTSFSAYAMAMHNDYGPNYVRYVGTNNPATGVNTSEASLNGAGNAMPVIGTGNTYYLQVGGTLPYFNKEQSDLQLQPAASVQLSDLDGLHDKAIVYDAGVSLLFNKMSSRMTLDAQNRPIFNMDAANNAVESGRKWQFVLKYRIDFN